MVQAPRLFFFVLPKTALPDPFQQLHPELVSRVVALDIGAQMPTTASFKFFMCTYQLLNVLLFLMGPPVGDWGTRAVMRLMRYDARPSGTLPSVRCGPLDHCIRA